MITPNTVESEKTVQSQISCTLTCVSILNAPFLSALCGQLPIHQDPRIPENEMKIP